MSRPDERRWGFQGIIDSLQWLFHVTLERLVGFAIVAYFSGWHYLDAYFSHFKVDTWIPSFDDYTIFLYSFYVLVTLPDILRQLEFDVVMAAVLLCVCFLFSAAKFPERFDTAKSFMGRLLMAAGGLWCLYVFSIEAGQMKAAEVSRDLEKRRIILTLTKEFRQELRASRNVYYADQFFEELEVASREGRVGLIWRSSNETLILLHNSTAKRAIAYRIPNKFVALIDANMEVEQ